MPPGTRATTSVSARHARADRARGVLDRTLGLGREVIFSEERLRFLGGKLAHHFLAPVGGQPVGCTWELSA